MRYRVMTHKTKTFLYAFLLISAVYMAYSAVRYFFHVKQPVFEILGIEQDASYGGTVQAIIQINSSYPIDSLMVHLDSKPLNDAFPHVVGARIFSLPVEIDTTQLEDGRHVLSVSASDASYHSNTKKTTLFFIVDNKSLEAQFDEECYQVSQGRCLKISIAANKQVAQARLVFAGAEHECYFFGENGIAYGRYLPIACDMQEGEYPLLAYLVDDVGRRIHIESTISVLPLCVTPSSKKKHLAACRVEKTRSVDNANDLFERTIAKWLYESPKKSYWTTRFCMPIKSHASMSLFGDTCGQLRHTAVDLSVDARDIVHASQDGRVVVKDSFPRYGNVVVLDHGMGIFSIYAHLNRFGPIEVGEVVKQGSPLGVIAAQQLKEAAPMHWEMRVDNIPVDPLQWVEKTA